MEKVSFDEITRAIKKKKLGKASELLKVSTEMISASTKVGIHVIVNLCERALERKGMPENWKTCVLVPIYKGKGDVTNYKAYRKVKLLEHGTKIIQRVLEKKIRALVVVDDMQFGFMPRRGTMHAGKRIKIVHVFCGKRIKIVCVVSLHEYTGLLKNNNKYSQKSLSQKNNRTEIKCF